MLCCSFYIAKLMATMKYQVTPEELKQIYSEDDANIAFNVCHLLQSQYRKPTMEDLYGTVCWLLGIDLPQQGFPDELLPKYRIVDIMCTDKMYDIYTANRLTTYGFIKNPIDRFLFKTWGGAKKASKNTVSAISESRAVKKVFLNPIVFGVLYTLFVLLFLALIGAK